MKVDIQHVEKSKGMVFKKKLHGVALTITFSEEEKAIIEQRKIGGDIIVERGVPADVDVDKHENRGLMKRVATAAVKGADANHFHLTFNKLLRGTDTYFFETPLEAKEYEQVLREKLPEAKEYIMANQAIDQKSDTFEL